MGIKDYIVDTQSKDWEPLIEKGVHFEGVFVKSLLYYEEKGRSTTIVLKFEAGANYLYQNPRGGEEAFVLRGEVFINEIKLSA